MCCSLAHTCPFPDSLPTPAAQTVLGSPGCTAGPCRQCVQSRVYLPIAASPRVRFGDRKLGFRILGSLSVRGHFLLDAPHQRGCLSFSAGPTPSPAAFCVDPLPWGDSTGGPPVWTTVSSAKTASLVGKGRAQFKSSFTFSGSVLAQGRAQPRTAVLPRAVRSQHRWPFSRLKGRRQHSPPKPLPPYTRAPGRRRHRTRRPACARDPGEGAEAAQSPQTDGAWGEAEGGGRLFGEINKGFGC